MSTTRLYAGRQWLGREYVPRLFHGTGGASGGNRIGINICVGPSVIEALSPAVPTFTPNLEIFVAPPTVEVIAPPPYRRCPD